MHALLVVRLMPSFGKHVGRGQNEQQRGRGEQNEGLKAKTHPSVSLRRCQACIIWERGPTSLYTGNGRRNISVLSLLGRDGPQVDRTAVYAFRLFGLPVPHIESMGNDSGTGLHLT